MCWSSYKAINYYIHAHTELLVDTFKVLLNDIHILYHEWYSDNSWEISVFSLFKMYCASIWDKIHTTNSWKMVNLEVYGLWHDQLGYWDQPWCVRILSTQENIPFWESRCSCLRTTLVNSIHKSSSFLPTIKSDICGLIHPLIEPSDTLYGSSWCILQMVLHVLTVHMCILHTSHVHSV